MRKKQYTAQLPVVVAEFARLAGDTGVIGAPDGKPAYAYLRVSTDEQSEPGRSGLPRQLEHIAALAANEGYAITLDRVFADDHSGFVLERPALDRLRALLKSPARPADVVLCEDVDRLAREGWILGFLERHDFAQCGVSVLYWAMPDGDQFMRDVRGAAQSAEMRKARARMEQGRIDKARKHGRITARRPAFGFQIVDSNGQPGLAAARDTHYAIVEQEAVIVRDMYARLAAGQSQTSIAREYNALYKPPRRMKRWTQSLIAGMASNPCYKGEFAANRWQQAKGFEKDGKGNLIKVNRNRMRDESEWIIVPCPAIVSPELWAAANDARLKRKNQIMAKRHAKGDFLLTGLVRCACCGYAVTGKTKRENHTCKDGSVSKYCITYYQCISRSKAKSQRDAECTNPTIRAETLESAVWGAVLHTLLEPDPLIAALQAEFEEGPNADKLCQIAYLEGEIDKAEKADAREHAAYLAEVVTLEEFSANRKARKAHVAALQAERQRLRGQVTSPEQFEAQKASLLAVSAQAKAAGLGPETDFETKQNIIKLLVDQITLDVAAGSFRLEGAIKGLYFLKDIAHTIAGACGLALWARV